MPSLQDFFSGAPLLLSGVILLFDVFVNRKRSMNYFLGTKMEEGQEEEARGLKKLFNFLLGILMISLAIFILFTDYYFEMIILSVLVPLVGIIAKLIAAARGLLLISNKKQFFLVVLSIFLSLTIVFLFVYDQTRHTTFKVAAGEVLERKIEKITIRDLSDREDKNIVRKLKVEDDKTIEQVNNNLAAMELKETFIGVGTRKYVMRLYYRNGGDELDYYVLVVGERSIHLSLDDNLGTDSYNLISDNYIFEKLDRLFYERKEEIEVRETIPLPF
ncbi:hypothetical protein PRVXH_000341 [Proteinivorax hydrogeniformans]|uniref:DUF3784 domain-containing protein n=1 Tax=Proteinivorax hydrogeniformans TaxID=1826727 RepID=A0AAU8HUH8_9FIRM